MAKTGYKKVKHSGDGYSTKNNRNSSSLRIQRKIARGCFIDSKTKLRLHFTEYVKFFDTVKTKHRYFFKTAVFFQTKKNSRLPPLDKSGWAFA